VTRVAVCALTFQRPKGLARLLEALAHLDIPPDVEPAIVIVDNDISGSADEQVARFAETSPWPVRFVVEGARGIPLARNAAVAAAGDADFVAFIDDDEIPDQRWLAELVNVQRREGADVVTGPVLPSFEEPPPEWLVKGRFFDRPRFPTGHRLDWATTSSVIIARRLLERSEPFNVGMRHSGGSDTHFFMRAVMEGATIVWAEEALVYETIPPSRARAGWLVRREYRRGNTLSICLRELRDTPVRRFRRVVHASLRMVEGAALITAGLLAGRTILVRGTQRAAFGLGMVTGLFGLRYQEYVVVHGS
jgi:succinoglycan biosynthesis protein ExoM